VYINTDALFRYLLDDLYGIGMQPNAAEIYPGAPLSSVVRSQLAKSLLRKLSDETSSEADNVCLEKFLRVNDACSEWELRCRYSWEEELVGCFKRAVDDFLHPGGETLVQSWFDLLKVGRAGPGASLGANGEDFYTKFFASTITTTSPWLYDLYNEFVGWFPVWRDAEISRALTHTVYSLTSSSTITFVRKNRDTSRSICTEPSLNMFYQLGLGEILRARLVQFFGIDLQVQQERNRDLACRGSLDDSVVTLDLESASDSVSLRMCAEMLPTWFNSILVDLRCPYTKCRGREIELNMVSTMGNGYTFALQTMLFCCVVRAAAEMNSIRLGKPGGEDSNWGVYGDDIIVPSEMARHVCRLLELLGFTVNSQKSFFEGPFRESCGGDYFRGHPVRGVYLKTLATPQARYVAINQLIEWSAIHGIPLPRSVGYLRDSVREFAIPFHEAPDAGIRCPEEVGSAYWNGRKQRFLYRCYEPVRTVLRFDDLGNVSTPRIRGKRIHVRTSNPNGSLVAFIGGYIKNRQVALPLKQGEAPVYRARWKTSHNWWPSAEQLTTQASWDFWVRWNTAAVETLRG
jgi:hypothetical protein